MKEFVRQQGYKQAFILVTNLLLFKIAMWTVFHIIVVSAVEFSSQYKIIVKQSITHLDPTLQKNPKINKGIMPHFVTICSKSIMVLKLTETTAFKASEL